MKTSKLKKRLAEDRPMTPISIRVPEDVIEDLKRIAPLRGFSGYQPLMRAYIGQGLREDLKQLEDSPSIESVIHKLEEHGVSRKVLKMALQEAQLEKRPA